jgi:ABC-type antimicrobial peptide transport system permease subunit
MTDLKFTLRQLLKNPVFTAVAILTLALGIGATTALFSVMYGVVVSPYPYARPGEIWAPGHSTVNFSAAMRPYEVRQYLEMAELPGFADTMATSPDQMLLTGDFAPQMLETVRISTNAPNFLGVAPILGRSIGPGDIRASGEAEPVAVISYGLWYRLFGGGPDALGQSLRLNDQPYTIIGVMPPRFGWWTNQGVWLPLGLDQPTRNVFPITRLAPGVTQAVAE